MARENIPEAIGTDVLDKFTNAFRVVSSDYPSEWESRLKQVFGYRPSLLFSGEFLSGVGKGYRFEFAAKGAFAIGSSRLSNLRVFVMQDGGLVVQFTSQGISMPRRTDAVDLFEQRGMLQPEQGAMRRLFRSGKVQGVGAVSIDGGAAYALPGGAYSIAYSVEVPPAHSRTFMRELDSLAHRVP